MIALLFISTLLAQTPAPETKLNQEKELEVIDFGRVQEVLKKDGLMQEAVKKKEEVKKIQALRAKEEVNRHLWPTETEFWPLATEYWLVKQVSVLRWDFDHPDYGLNMALGNLLKTVGFTQKKYRLLALDSPSPGHLSLPWTEGEYCLLFSVPFMRAMDLSKLEISLLFLEDILRSQEGWLKEAVRPAKLKDLVGSNFVGKKPDMTPMFEVGVNYSKFLKEKGFNFQQQFQITKRMDTLLKPHPDLWNAYVRLLGKIDRLVKGNNLFNDYVKLYPSPEMQIRWLAPEEKIP